MVLLVSFYEWTTHHCFNIYQTGIPVCHNLPLAQPCLLLMWECHNRFKVTMLYDEANSKTKDTATTTCFRGRCEELKEHVYDSSSSRLSNELFTRTTKEITEYVTHKYSGAGDFHTGLINMAFQLLTSPPPPD